MVQHLDGVGLPDESVVARTYMVCCAADAVGLGFRVDDQRIRQFEDGEWVIIRGRITENDRTDAIRALRLGVAAFTMVSPDHALDASTIDAYDAFAYMPAIVERLAGDGTSRFRALLQRAQLLDELRTGGPYTVFAPVDQAVDHSGADQLDGAALSAWLGMHIVRGRLSEDELFQMDSLTTIDDRRIPVGVANGRLRVGNVRLLFGNIKCRNGTIHLVYPAMDPVPRAAP
jgi:uncharacterized surface protein with fasciclin (FAS1) repeats